MKAKKILYATDFSAGSDGALDYASSLAAFTGAHLIIAHVDDTTPGLLYGDIDYGYVPEVDQISEHEFESLQNIKPTISSVTYEYKFARGNAHEEILRLADEECVDMIVIGTHGRTGLSLALMGSVAEKIVREATCPVLTVKQPAYSTKPKA